MEDKQTKFYFQPYSDQVGIQSERVSSTSPSYYHKLWSASLQIIPHDYQEHESNLRLKFSYKRKKL